jgi:hypothetical protein
MAETITSKAMSKHGADGGGMVEYEGGAAGVGKNRTRGSRSYVRSYGV